MYLNAAIFGFSERDIDRRFDDIVEFAEVADFIDSPVRTYSSGMQMRLAFAVASHVKADIMLLDEVFAVGDEAFQRKCTARMFEFKRDGGTLVQVEESLQGFFPTLFRPTFQRQLEKGINTSLEELKQAAEQRG